MIINGKSCVLRLAYGKDVSRNILWPCGAEKYQGQIEDTAPIETRPCIAITSVRPLEKMYPKDFEAHTAKTKQSRIQAHSNERVLLNKFLCGLP